MTFMLDDTLDTLSAQRALEALRSGVPNRDAVRALGTTQPKAIDAFSAMLESLATDNGPHRVGGLLLSADFGVGKSHTLRLLEQIALQENYAVSTVVISKETPLHDLHRLFLAAVRNGRLPDTNGEFVQDLSSKYDQHSHRAKSFGDWGRRHPQGLIEATVVLHDELRGADDTQQIVEYWAGEKIAVSEVRRMLKAVNVTGMSLSQIRQAELAPIRFELISRLIDACGYKGWIILFDESELIGRFSVLQRAKAYAHLAQWTSFGTQRGIPGIGSVFTITEDYPVAILDQLHEEERIASRLEARGSEADLALLTLANSGMEVIRSGGIRLDKPNSETVRHAHERLVALYDLAYGVRPDTSDDVVDGTGRDMRIYVRRWVNTWDLRRLNPGAVLETEVEEIDTVTRTEDKDFQSSISDED